ncbi:MAG: TraR/DksA C4-type zinc finger protein [Phycisphaerae bacterium]|nr:TraR/DksA C4-type zinc finger protein [Phycisphaerae bacterium]
MAKKTTPIRDKKAKTAARSSKGTPKTKTSPARKQTAKGKPVESAPKAKVAGKGPAVSAKASKATTGSKPKTPARAGKTDKQDKLTQPEAKSSGKTPIRAKSASASPAAGAPTKAILKPPTPAREPREIAGLPKLPAFGSIFERPGNKEPKKSGGNGDSIDDSPSDRPVETYLTDAELDEFRQLLLSKRQEIVRDVTNLEDEAIRQASGAGTSSSMPIHMADLGTDTWEQELTLGLIENERSLLREIDEAIERIENRTYGICLATNKRISKARLQAKPWAKYCIEYARRRELGLA